MKRISMTAFRKSPGEFLLDVIRDGESYMLTKAGKDAARLLPASEDTVINGSGKRIAGPRLGGATAGEAKPTGAGQCSECGRMSVINPCSDCEQ